MVKFSGFVAFAEWAAYAIIFGFLWRTISALLSETKIGQAMAYIY